MRYDFQLASQGLEDRLLSCFSAGPSKSSTITKQVNRMLNDELYYIICWNPDLFPEVQATTVGRKSFPLRVPGKSTSMFTVLEADSVDLRTLDFAKPGLSAQIIFTALLARVQAAVPLSPVLYEASPSWDAQTAEQLSRQTAGTRRSSPLKSQRN